MPPGLFHWNAGAMFGASDAEKLSGGVSWNGFPILTARVHEDFFGVHFLPLSFCLRALLAQEQGDRKREAERSLGLVGHARTPTTHGLQSR